MSARRRRARAAGLALAATGAAAGITLQRSHALAIAKDPVYARLREPLGGRALPVISADGTRLHTLAFGPEAGTTVVLAHGWTETLMLWGPVIRILTQDGVRVVAYDLRGHGDSSPAEAHDYSLERFGEDVQAVLETAACAGGRAVVAGHSLGAMSIAAWAGSHEASAHARAAALINTGLGDLLTGHLLFGEAAKRLNSRVAGRVLLGSRAPLPAFSSPLSHALIRHAAFGPTAGTGQVAFYERMLMDTSPDARAAAGVAISDMDLRDAVARLDVPTLVVAGDRDRLTPPDHSRRIADALPQPAGLLVLSETGHMSPLERPAEISAALGELIFETADRIEV